MIEGIQVLSQEPIMSDGNLGITVCIIITIVCGIAGLVVDCFYDRFVGIMICILGCLASGIIGINVYNANAEPTGQYEYKVIIDDSVSMTEFHTHYKLVGQDGEIFIIRDKAPASE